MFPYPKNPVCIFEKLPKPLCVHRENREYFPKPYCFIRKSATGRPKPFFHRKTNEKTPHIHPSPFGTKNKYHFCCRDLQKAGHRLKTCKNTMKIHICVKGENSENPNQNHKFPRIGRVVMVVSIARSS